MQRGFVLIYTILIISILLVTIGTGFNSVRRDILAARKEAESLKAFYAAESGVDCIKYYHRWFSAFNPTTPPDTYYCNENDSFNAGGNAPDCDAGNLPPSQPQQILLDDFSNGSCANVEVTVTSHTVDVGGTPTPVCGLEVVSRGKNSCGGGGAISVERTRWETF